SSPVVRLPCNVTLYLFFFYCSPALRDLHSFPTRRSSDLTADGARPAASVGVSSRDRTRTGRRREEGGTFVLTNAPIAMRMGKIRSEEHTSELQSRENLVCRLLLEKKKNTITNR